MRALVVLVPVALAVLAVGCGGGRCPRGTTPSGRATPDDRQEWCEKRLPDGRLVWDGPFRSYFPDGTLLMQGQFKDGDAAGRWQSWYEGTGILHHDADLPDGIRRTFHPNGRPADVMQYTNNGQLRTGHWQEWFPDGTLKSDAWYPDGYSIDWHPNGVRHLEGPVKNGEREGVWYLYTDQGNIAGAGRFESGKENGIFLNFAREDDEKPLGTPLLGRIMVDGSQLNLVMQVDLPKVAADCAKNGYEACCEHHETCRRWIPHMTHAQEEVNRQRYGKSPGGTQPAATAPAAAPPPTGVTTP